MDLRARELTRAANLLPGVLAGSAGLLGFLVVHHVWIVPIWGVLPLGAVVAIPGGIAAQASYRQLRRTLPGRPWAGPALVAVAAAILAPSLLLRVLGEPLLDVTAAGSSLAVSVWSAWRVFLVELLLVSTVSGGLAGWLLGRTRRAVWTTALAGLALALGPGHNVPFFAGTPRAGIALGLVAAAILPSALTLVEADARLAPGRGQDAELPRRGGPLVPGVRGAPDR